MTDGPDSKLRVNEIAEWLSHRVATMVRVPMASIDMKCDLIDCGLDSTKGLELLAELEDLLGRQLPDTLLLDFRTIAAVASEAAARERRQ
jgi:acyl carrier protein